LGIVWGASAAARNCLFVDILRPSLIAWLLSGIVTSIRLVMAPVRRIFYAQLE
jgi:hypothetical protein